MASGSSQPFFLNGNQSVAEQAVVPVSEAAPALPDSATAVPAAPGYANETDERMALAQQLGTLAYVLQNAAPGGLFPDNLTVDGSTGAVLTSTGQSLARVNPDSTFSYAVSADRTNYSTRVIGAQFGSVVTFDSMSGVVVTHLPG